MADLKTLQKNQAADERRAATATGKKQDEILARINRRQEKIDAAQAPKPELISDPTSDPIVQDPIVDPVINLPTQTYTAPDGTTFTDANAYVSYLTLLAGERTETARKEEEKRLREEETGFRRQSAFEVLRERFTAFGLPTIAAEIEKIFKGEGRTRIGGSPIPIPTSESGFFLALVETEAYYKRFGKVNEDRIKSGYTALDEKTILDMEDEYQKVMKSYGTPAGFYDTPEDFQAFLANDLSESEVADRLQASRQFASVVDPVIKDQLKSMYNIDDNMLTAYIADPVRGQSLLTGLANKSLTGAAALLQGITAEAAAVAQGFGAGELRFQEQQQRFGLAASGAERGTFLSRIDQAEKEFGQKEAVEITFGGLEQSARAAERLASRERARFGGRSGITTASLATPTAGQY
jgi:hypothetical protein